MSNEELIRLAEGRGFAAAVLDAAGIPVNAKFRPFCAENRCGQYNANYSCPPTCGTPQEMEAKLRAGRLALVLKTEWPIRGYEDHETIRRAKAEHNEAMLRLNESLEHPGLCAGGSCCSLCSPLPHGPGGTLCRPETPVQLYVRLLRGCGGAGKALRHGLFLGSPKLTDFQHDRTEIGLPPCKGEGSLLY